MVTWTRMTDGQWGIIGPADVIGRNAQIEVTRKSGEKKTVGIGRIVWTGESKYGKGRVSIAEVVVARRGGRRYECDECGEYVTAGSRCWETGAGH